MKEFDVIAIASPTELPLVRDVLENQKLDRYIDIVITGVGALNVFRALDKYDRNTRILNIGYCGSPDIKVGTHCNVGKCILSHKVTYSEPTFTLDGDVPCCTGIDFALSGEKGKVYDMELAFICAMGFKVQAVKVVSDNMDYDEYEDTVNGRN